jgi:hypothetical protein
LRLLLLLLLRPRLLLLRPLTKLRRRVASRSPMGLTTAHS